MGSEHHSVFDNSGFCTALICALVTELFSALRLLWLNATKVRVLREETDLSRGRAMIWPCLMTKRSPLHHLETSPEIIRLDLMMYVRFPRHFGMSKTFLPERGIEISHETFRFWWPRFGPIFAVFHPSVHDDFKLDRTAVLPSNVS
jgi:hypothetical protein